MAAVTKCFGTVALNSTTEVTVTLDERFAYQVKHTGVDAAGTDDANSALVAYLSYASGVTVSMAEEDDKYPLMDGQSVEIGPGISTLYIDAASGADAILAFARKGTLTRAW
jgi:hypothetical protein